MKPIATLLLLLLLQGCGAASPAEEEMTAYLMVYHTDPTHGLHMALSRDGYTFTALNGGRPVIAGDTIALQRGIRDPHIYRGPDGTFYLAMTDLHIYAQREGYRDTEWERDGARYGWGNNRALVLMRSRDLIHWSRANVRFDTLAPEMAEVGCVWAPETIYDRGARRLMIYYTMRMGNGQNRLCYSYVNDAYDSVQTLPQLLYEYPDKGISAIDGDITCHDGLYHLFYVAHDGTPGIKHAVSDRATGPYRYLPEWCDNEQAACEAPNVWERTGEGKWVLMYDIYGITPHNFGFMETSDFNTFEPLGRFNEGVMKAANFTSPKHGAVIPVTEAEAGALERYWAERNRAQGN